MKNLLFLIALVAIALSGRADDSVTLAQDTNMVIKLNKQGFLCRMNNAHQTVEYATQALTLAQKLEYKKGIAESYRIMGVGNYYLNHSIKAIENYLTSLDLYTKMHDLRGEAKVYNNIGNLYRDNDYDEALRNLRKSLDISQKLADKQLTANLNFNIANVLFRKGLYNQALESYNKCQPEFIELGDSTNFVLCLQSKGVVYYYQRQLEKAEPLLLQAVQNAKKIDLNEPIASIDLTLAALYIAKDKYTNAANAIQEGLAYAAIIKDDKIASDFKYTSYRLELKQGNYKKALDYLTDIYRQDSTSYKQSTSTQLDLFREQVKRKERQRENEILLEHQQYDRLKFWGVAVVAGLLLGLVGLLISNVRSKAKTNEELNELNAEISRQKDNLDRINHHLEEIIDERTKDLQVKNKKLSEYSSYLSHQIRGPIATLKGLLNLEKEGLVDQQECIKMMNKCVSEIDDKIIEMSDMLHDPVKTSL